MQIIEFNHKTKPLDWLHQQKQTLQEHLKHDGIVLIRGLNLSGTADFSRAGEVFNASKNDYAGGATPRKQISNTVFTATEMDPSYEILLHNEMSYAPSCPSTLLFFSGQVASQGGQTVFADNQAFIKNLPSELKHDLLNRQVIYLRRLRTRDQWGLSLSWQDVMQCETKSEAEIKCQKLGYTFEWQDHSLVLKSTKRLIKPHSLTSEPYFFSNLFVQLPWFTKQFRPLLDALGEKNISSDVVWDDHSIISLDYLSELYEHYNHISFEHNWQKDDFLFVDNFKYSHGRRPFTGGRELYVSLCDIRNNP